jgi:hypothetical protein
LVATGGQAPYTWSATAGAPPGLSIASNGAISGVPTRAGVYTLAAHLADASGASRDVQIRLAVHARLKIATSRLAAATAGHAYSAKIAVRGGVVRFRWTITGLPRGLTFSARTRIISGTPATSGTFRVKLRVRDALGAVSTKVVTLRVT